MKEMMKKKTRIGFKITIWQGITMQGLCCHLDIGNNTAMYYKCSHVQKLNIMSMVNYKVKLPYYDPNMILFR